MQQIRFLMDGYLRSMEEKNLGRRWKEMNREIRKGEERETLKHGRAGNRDLVG